MKQIVLIFAIITFNISSLLSQGHHKPDSLLDDFEKNRKQIDNELKSFKEEADREYLQFKNEADRQYADYLKQTWESYNQVKADSFFKEKEITKPPIFSDENKISTEQINSKGVKTTEKKAERPVILLKDTSTVQSTFSVAFDFYGNTIYVNYNSNILPVLTYPLDESIISKCWSQLVISNYESVINQLMTYKLNLGLNDYAYLQLIRSFSKQITPDKNKANFLSWVLLNKSGYKAKIGYSDSIYLLVPFKQIVYNNSSLLIEGEKYYLMDSTNKSIKSFAKEDKNARLLLDLNITNSLRFMECYVIREIQIPKYSISMKLTLNKNIIDFYSDYPQTEPNVYMDAAISESLLDQIHLYFDTIIRNKSIIDGINLLLKFCQNSTKYKDDNDVFGKEKFMFTEESLFYKYTDCDDRAILFVRLINELMKKYCIGLQYKGHMAAAVETDSLIKGTYVDNKYIVCDPTYIDAPIGTLIPECEGQNPLIILPDTNLASESKRLQMVNYIKNYNISLWDKENSVVFDKTGNCYFVGSFKENLSIGRYNFKTPSENNAIVIGKIDKKGNVLWCKQISGKGNDMGHCIRILPDADIIVAFSFNDSLRIKSYVLYTPKKDYCIARFDNNGDLKWFTPVNATSLNLSEDDYLLCSLTSNGSIEWIKSENNSFMDQRFNLTYNNEAIVFTAPSNKIKLEKITASYSSFDLFELPGQIVSEYQRLIKLDVENTAAGIFAMGNLLQKSGNIMSGRAIQAALNKENEQFKKNNADFYDGLSNIIMIKNNNGKLSVTTKEKVKVKLDKLIIEDGALFSMIFLPNGNLRIDIEKGIKALLFDLNYAVVSKKEGTIIFDYSKAHQQKSMKIKPEIVQ